MNKKLRIYVDTSVFGGVFDIEFMEPSNTFFQQVRSGQFLLCTSVLLKWSGGKSNLRQSKSNIFMPNTRTSQKC